MFVRQDSYLRSLIDELYTLLRKKEGADQLSTTTFTNPNQLVGTPTVTLTQSYTPKTTGTALLLVGSSGNVQALPDAMLLIILLNGAPTGAIVQSPAAGSGPSVGVASFATIPITAGVSISVAGQVSNNNNAHSVTVNANSLIITVIELQTN